MNKQLLSFVALFALLVGCADEDPGVDTDPDPTAECGNNSVETGETCDDGNTLSGDGCSAFCVQEEVCDDGADNDGDDNIDCLDRDCANHAACGEPTEDCDTVGDEDGDGNADCDDSDCAAEPACSTATEDCDTEGDEDGNDLADCADPACSDDPAWQTGLPEDCETGGDEDGNDLSDCDDPACSEHASCQTPVEDCDTEGDEDGNELADCDDPACADLEACDNCGDGTLQEDEDETCDNGEENADEPNLCRLDCQLPTCGDDIIDDAEPYEEVCDDGALNNDRAPNACREDCSLPYCGDGVVDNGSPYFEECEVDAGGEDDPCTAECAFKDRTRACGEDITVDTLGDDFRVEETGEYYRAVFELSGTTSYIEPGIECGEDLERTFSEKVFLYTPPEEGTFIARTDFAGTEIDTVLYARSPACLSGPAECNDDAGPDTAGSWIVFDASPDVATFLVVDSAGGFGQVVLEVFEYNEVGDGDECDPPFALCGEGFACLPNGDVDTCQQAYAPVGTDLTAVAVPLVTESGGIAWQMWFRLQGSDENSDVTGFEGTLINSDEAESGPLSFEPSVISYLEDGSFDSTTILGFGETSPMAAGFTSVSGVIVDSGGLTSEVMNADIVGRTVGAENADCDGFISVCASGLSCLPSGDEGARTCQTGTEIPVITALDASWDSPNGVVYHATGTDVDGDPASIEVTYIDQTGVDGVPIEGAGGLPITLVVDFQTTRVTYNEDTSTYDWEGWGAVYYTNPGAAALVLPAARAVAIDQSGNRSVDTADSELPWPTPADVDEACDAAVEESVCAFGLVCDDFVGDEGTCRELTLGLNNCIVTEEEDGSIALLFFIEQGLDAALDPEAQIGIFAFDLFQGPTLRDSFAVPIAPAPFTSPGQFLLSLTGVEDILVDGDTHVVCHVKSSPNDGGASDFVRAELDIPLGPGEKCTPYVTLCQDELACMAPEEGEEEVCLAGSAPIIEGTTLTRPDLMSVSLTIDLGDADLDMLDAYYLAWFDPDSGHIIVPPYLQAFAMVEPVSRVDAVEDVVIDVAFPDEVFSDMTIEEANNLREVLWLATETIEVIVVDLAGFTDRIEVNINIAEGESCSVDSGSVPCQAGLTCTNPGSGFVCN